MAQSYLNIGPNMIELMEKNEISRSRLARDLGVPYSTVCDWLTQRSTPRVDKLDQIAKCLGVDLSELFKDNCEDSNNVNNVSNNSNIPKPIKIDFLGSLDRSNVVGAIYVSSEEYPYAEANPTDFWAMKIRGDSMAPFIQDDDTVVVQKTKDWRKNIQPKDIAIAKVNGDIVCKEIAIEEESKTITFIPANLRYLATTYTNNDIEKGIVNIYGKVIEIRRKGEKFLAFEKEMY